MILKPEVILRAGRPTEKYNSFREEADPKSGNEMLEDEFFIVLDNTNNKGGEDETSREHTAKLERQKRIEKDSKEASSCSSNDCFDFLQFINCLLTLGMEE